MTAFLFDLDGTLADNMPSHQQAWNALFPALGVTVDEADFFRWSAGLTNREIFPRLLGRALNDAELAVWSERKEALYREIYGPQMAEIAGASAWLDRLTQAGRSCAVGTAAPPENAAMVLDGLNLRRYFRAVVGGADIQHGKPHPEVFLRAAERLGVPPEAYSRCVVFEDAPAGIEAAFRAGMRCVVVTTSLRAEDIATLPNHQHVLFAISDFRDERLVNLLRA